MSMQKGFTLIEVMIVVVIVGILAMIAAGAMKENTQITETSDDMNGRLLNPDGTPVRPSNDQIGHYSNAGSSAETNTGTVAADYIKELCHDGEIYLLVIKDGERFPLSPKVDMFGYPVKCSN